MAISDKNRRMLWGQSAGMCAFCRCQLVHKSKNTADLSLIGEECHIISKKSNGPRGEFYKTGMDGDAYENFILLCRNHHKLIDDQPQNFSVEYLQELKGNHEIWVKETLENGAIKFKKKTSNYEINDFLPRILNSKNLINILNGAYGYEFNTPEFKNRDEMNEISSFLQCLQDYGDLLPDFEIGQKIEAEFELKEMIKNIESKGFWLFGKSIKRKIKFSDNSSENWDIAIISIIKDDDPTIIKLDFNELLNKK